MKRTLRIAIVVIMLLSTEIVIGQDLGFGLKGGLNLASLKIDDPEASYKSKVGYHAGIFLRAKFSKIAVQPELLLFTQKTNGEFAGLGDIEDNFTYVSIPVILKFYPIAGLNLQAGPQFGFLVDGERKYDTILGTFKEDIKDSYKKSDVSISVGGGYDFGFGLGLDVRYNIGLKDINNAADGEEVKSQVFLVSIGWNFLN
jgi:hypothetical protein